MSTSPCKVVGLSLTSVSVSVSVPVPVPVPLPVPVSFSVPSSYSGISAKAMGNTTKSSFYQTFSLMFPFNTHLHRNRYLQRQWKI